LAREKKDDGPGIKTQPRQDLRKKRKRKTQEAVIRNFRSKGKGASQGSGEKRSE